MRFGKPVETYFSTGFYVDISMICANNLLNKKDFYVKKYVWYPFICCGYDWIL